MIFDLDGIDPECIWEWDQIPRDERNPSGEELVTDLRRLKQRLESGPLERSPGREPGKQRMYDTVSGTRFAGVRLLLTHKLLLAAVFLAAIVIGLNLTQLRHWLTDEVMTVPIDSLVVLPLANLSGDTGQDHFADGVTDALIADLSPIGALRVISRTSAMSYKGTKKPVPEIARELNVDAVVEGSVLRSRDQVRITARLIHAATEKPLWSQTYERDLRNVFTLIREVAQTIANEIKVTVTPLEHARLARAHVPQPDAYIAYSKGRFHWNKRTEEGLRKAIEYFEEAIRIDPNYALAYDGLADCWLPQAWYAYLPPREAFPRAKEAANKALQLDDSLAEAHTTLAFIKLYFDWDWDGAGQEFRRAIELNPNYANAHITGTRSICRWSAGTMMPSRSRSAPWHSIRSRASSTPGWGRDTISPANTMRRLSNTAKRLRWIPTSYPHVSSSARPTFKNGCSAKPLPSWKRQPGSREGALSISLRSRTLSVLQAESNRH